MTGTIAGGITEAKEKNEEGQEEVGGGEEEEEEKEEKEEEGIGNDEKEEVETSPLAKRVRFAVDEEEQPNIREHPRRAKSINLSAYRFIDLCLSYKLCRFFIALIHPCMWTSIIPGGRTYSENSLLNFL